MINFTILYQVLESEWSARTRSKTPVVKYRVRAGEQKSLFTERLLYIIIGATGRYASVGDLHDPKYSAIAKIASSRSNCDRVLVAWIFICTRSSVARICLRKTRALLGSLYNVMSRCGIVAWLPRFHQRGTDLPAETNFAEPLEVFIKTTTFPGTQRGEKYAQFLR